MDEPRPTCVCVCVCVCEESGSDDVARIVQHSQSEGSRFA